MRHSFKILTIVVLVSCCSSISAQVRTITFTGRDRTNQYHIPLHHVTVFNLDQLWEEVLYYPDTILTMGDGVGMDESGIPQGLQLMQNVPNPFDGTTEFVLVLPEDNDVTLEIYDLSGKLTISRKFSALGKGSHLFNASLVSPQTYLLGAITRNGQTTIKMVNEGHGGENSITHVGMVNTKGDITVYLKEDRGNAAYPFHVGDTMEYTGYTVLLDGSERVSNTVKKSQINNETIALMFNMTLPNLRTMDVINITSTSAICRSEILDNGGELISTRGICWNTSPNPSISNSHTTSNSGATGTTYSDIMTNLIPNCTYYVRAYATNLLGTNYGEERSFNTLCNDVNVTISGVTSINYGQSTTLYASGAPYYLWNTGVTQDHITVNPTTTTTYSVTGSDSYGCTGTAIVTVIVNNNPPTVTTNNVTSFTATTATCGGNVTNNGGATITERGVCWSTSTNPTLNDSYKAYGSGAGSFSFNISGLADNTTYYVKAYATYSGGTVYGDVKTFTTSSFTCGNSTTDYDGNSYNTVQIGQQCWMKQNLKTTHLNDGVAIPLVQDSTSWGNTTSAAYCYYNISSYGCLYNYYAVDGNQLCPPGWHVPSYDEVHTTLRSALGEDGGGGMKTTGTTYWLSPNTGATNSSGFSARGGGYRPSAFSFSGIKEQATFWISTIYNNNYAYDYHLMYNSSSLSRYGSSNCDYAIWKRNGLSVRCLRGDIPPVTYPTVNTYSVTNISSETATCGGSISVMGNAVITAKGVCWGTSPNPSIINDSFTNEGGGVMSFTSNLTGLTAGTIYYVRAYATNSAGTSYGQQVTFTTESPFICGSVIYDWDNHPYNTVQIGNQCWMKKNLRTKHYANGTSIQYGGSDSSSTTPYYYYPNNNSNTEASYGLLYNWSAVMHGESSNDVNPSGVQGICPNGWHVPSHAEWTELIKYVGSQAQYVCGSSSGNIAKALASSTGWDVVSGSDICAVGYNQSSNNATGFGAMPANYGWGDYIGELGQWANFWSATSISTASANSCFFTAGAEYVSNKDNGGFAKWCGLSVRCVCNEFYMETPKVTTNLVSNVSSTSAVCGGNIISSGETPVTARGVCWSSYPYPIITDSHTTNSSGTGSFTSTITGLSAGATYYVRAYATNSAGTAYGEQRIINTTPSYSGTDGQPCPNAATVSDYDGNSYPTVQIGSQCWMARNLRTTHYANGNAITPGESNYSSTVPYYYNYSSSGISLVNRGYLYNWPAAMCNSSTSITNPSGVQGVCPNGWHVPSDAEWRQLADYVGSQSQYLCYNYSYIAKALASTSGWESASYTCVPGYMQNNNNSTGFNAFPAGYSYGSNSFYGTGTTTLFISASELCSSLLYYHRLYYNQANLERPDYAKFAGYSVRCLKN